MTKIAGNEYCEVKKHICPWSLHLPTQKLQFNILHDGETGNLLFTNERGDTEIWLQDTGQSGLTAVVKMRKMSRRWASVSLDLKRFLFKFITENVCSHK